VTGVAGRASVVLGLAAFWMLPTGPASPGGGVVVRAGAPALRELGSLVASMLGAERRPARAPSSPMTLGRRQDPLRTRLRALEDRVAADPVEADLSIVIGRSARGRPIRLAAIGNPAGSVGFDPKLLVFGCIHGTECAATAIRIRESVGCPLHDASLLWVPNLNPDGLALGTRINGRGVDLNRNFPAGWKPIGRRFSPQYSGPRPFSEPESRLAARLIQAVRPSVTIWFHQQEQPPLVRAWGRSVPVARRFAQLVDLPLVRLPWLAGTAPHWQNTRLRGTSSFVVELPPGPLSSSDRLRFGAAVVHFARSLDGGE
jgi:protein MpaA